MAATAPDVAQGSIVVRFGDAGVAVSTDQSDVAAEVRRIFAALLQPSAPRIVGRLHVSHAAGAYLVEGGGTVALEDGSFTDLVRCVRFQVIQLLVQARPDLLWLHAGAAAAGGRAVLFPGRRGSGKSSLVAAVCRHGWSYLSDDVVPLQLETGALLPFPQTAAVRPDPGRDMPEAWLRGPTKSLVPMASGCTATEPSRLAAIVFPEFRRGASAELRACSPAQAAAQLLGQCWNLAQHGETGVGAVCRIVAPLAAFRLTFGRVEDAVPCLDNIFPAEMT